MTLITQTLTVLVALLHLLFLILEMFLWTTPFGLKTFGMTQQLADSSRTLAMNQGLYNGFLAAGLLYGLLSSDNRMVMFFLICVVIAGLFGAATVSSRIFWIQALPAILALVSGYFFKGQA
jgi:putative membrane protein